MTLLHTLRQAAWKVGLDFQRLGSTNEAQIVRILRKRGIDCVIDVGAGRGQFGQRLRRFGYEGWIHSFEPLPEAYSSLSRASSRDPHWSTWAVALGPTDGTVILNVAGNEAGASSSVLGMLPLHEAALPEATYVRRIEVPMRSLDSIWGEIVPVGAKPLVKLDVQGFEGAVLDGAGESADQFAGLQLEISLAPLYEGALTLRELLARTEELGMRLVWVEPGFADQRTGELLQMDGVFFRPSAHTRSEDSGSGQRSS